MGSGYWNSDEYWDSVFLRADIELGFTEALRRNNRSSSPTTIGEFEIPLDARLRGTYVVGKTGTGKSNFLSQMIAQDIEEERGVMVLDPHGGLVDDVMKTVNNLDRVQILELTDTEYPFGLNIYECSDPTDPLTVARTVSPVMQLFERLWGAESQVVSWGPRMAQYLRNCALLLVDNPGYTMAEIPLLLTQKAPRQRLVENCANPSVRAFWEAFEGLPRRDQLDRVDSTFNKVDDFVSSPLVRNIVGQSESTIDIDALMAESGVLLVKLDPQLTDLTAVVGALLISRVLSSALKRGDGGPLFCLYADEYQRFATPDFATLLSEARKYNVATTIAHQFRGQLDERNRGASLQSGSVIVFEVTPSDAVELSGLFDATPPEPIVTGQRPVLGTANNPTEILTHRGHSDPAVMAIFNRTVRVWRDALHSVDIKETKKAPIQQALTAIDQYLTEAMHGRLEDHGELLAKAVRGLGEYVGLSTWTIRDETLGEAVASVARGASGFEELCQAITDYHRNHSERMEETELMLNERRRALELGDIYEFVGEGDDRQRIEWESIGGYAQRKYTPVTTINADYDRNAEQIRQQFQRDTWTDQGQHDAELITAIVSDLTQLGDLLKADPLVSETGRYEPIYDSPRPYADMSGEIANELSTQGRFHAWAKILDEQVVDDVPLGEAGSMNLTIAEEVRRASRERYGRPRAEVEQEIRDRQVALLTFEDGGSQKKPPPRIA